MMGCCTGHFAWWKTHCKSYVQLLCVSAYLFFPFPIISSSLPFRCFSSPSLSLFIPPLPLLSLYFSPPLLSLSLSLSLLRSSLFFPFLFPLSLLLMSQCSPLYTLLLLFPLLPQIVWKLCNGLCGKLWVRSEDQLAERQRSPLHYKRQEIIRLCFQLSGFHGCL